MKISVITVCFNSESTILDCIKSVSQQNHPDLQHVIIDGKSKDQTIEIIERFMNTHSHKIKLISEPDKGIYDAMNKGILHADGEIIGFLNADDYFADTTTVSKINAAILNSNADGCYGDLEIVSPKDAKIILRRWTSGHMPQSKMRNGWHPAHPTFYIRRQHLVDDLGFRLKYKIAADYELMLRKIMVDNIQLTYIGEPLVKMRAGGASNGTFSNIMKANKECYKAWLDNNLNPKFSIIALKLLWKIKQRILGVMQ